MRNTRAAIKDEIDAAPPATVTPRPPRRVSGKPAERTADIIARAAEPPRHVAIDLDVLPLTAMSAPARELSLDTFFAAKTRVMIDDPGYRGHAPAWWNQFDRQHDEALPFGLEPLGAAFAISALTVLPFAAFYLIRSIGGADPFGFALTSYTMLIAFFSGLLACLGPKESQNSDRLPLLPATDGGVSECVPIGIPRGATRHPPDLVAPRGDPDLASLRLWNRILGAYLASIVFLIWGLLP